MSTVINLNDFRKKKEQSVEKNTKDYQTTKYQRVLDGVLAEWDCYSASNRLEQYLLNKIGVSEVNIFSLDAISSIEQALNMTVAVFYPGSLPAYKNGYIVGFNSGDFNFTTPEMNTEVYARLLGILLFLEVRSLKKQGIL